MKIEKRGGARKNAGRKKLSEQAKTRTIRLTDSRMKELKEKYGGLSKAVKTL